MGKDREAAIKISKYLYGRPRAHLEPAGIERVKYMARFNIAVKIWMSIGIFVLGYVLSTALGQFQGIAAEATLRRTSGAIFPAAQQSQEAEAAFQRVVKGFADAVITQDKGGLDRAVEDGRAMRASLNAIASIPGLPVEREDAAKRLAQAADSYLNEAGALYRLVVADPAAMAQRQEQVRAMAARTEELKASLAKTKDLFSQDLHQGLAAAGQRSATQRHLALAVFGLSLVAAGIIVTFTIRKAITGPVVRVIHGVQRAADSAAQSSQEMAERSQAVQRDAQEQAACLEETSASLEEIAATSEQNARRALDADGLMQAARQTATQASSAMDDLTACMDLVSSSSNQVASVLRSIDEIAFHTNILALNAAVEAARAGQAGAGFSVVADEVRSLAQRAAEASRNSAGIIEKTIVNVTKGVGLVSQAHDAFQEVSAKITSGSDMISQIATSSQEQARGVGHISQAITRIEKVTQSNAANALRSAEVSHAMAGQVEATRSHLRELVAVVGL
jgi:methyl-accepting chemotaxis protein